MKKWWIGFGTLAIGVCLIVMGAARGEAEVVFEKAIRICMECIGIG